MNYKNGRNEWNKTESMNGWMALTEQMNQIMKCMQNETKWNQMNEMNGMNEMNEWMNEINAMDAMHESNYINE